jgi:hypothetical protein
MFRAIKLSIMFLEMVPSFGLARGYQRLGVASATSSLNSVGAVVGLVRTERREVVRRREFRLLVVVRSTC